VGTTTWRRGGGLTEKKLDARGPESDPLQREGVLADEALTTRLVWQRIYGRLLTDDDLVEIEGNLFRFIHLLASISGSILGARELSTTDGDEAA
jgi:hypothetical protein